MPSVVEPLPAMPIVPVQAVVAERIGGDMANFDEKFLAKVFDGVTDPFAIYDREFRIFRVNQALLTLFKLPAEKVIGRYCYELFYDRTSICEDCHVKEVFEYGESRMLVI